MSKIDSLLDELFANGRSIGHERAVTALEWQRNIDEAKSALYELILEVIECEVKSGEHKGAKYWYSDQVDALNELFGVE